MVLRRARAARWPRARRGARALHARVFRLRAHLARISFYSFHCHTAAAAHARTTPYAWVARAARARTLFSRICAHAAPRTLPRVAPRAWMGATCMRARCTFCWLWISSAAAFPARFVGDITLALHSSSQHVEPVGFRCAFPHFTTCRSCHLQALWL